MYRNILLPTDGSELAGKGISHGLELARTLGAKVTLVTVTEPWSSLAMAEKARAGDRNPVARYDSTMAEAASGILNAALAKARAAGVEATAIHISDGHPAESIIQTAAEKGCDLIVMASHGRRGASRLMLGSQTHEVVTHTRIPVLVIR